MSQGLNRAWPHQGRDAEANEIARRQRGSHSEVPTPRTRPAHRGCPGGPVWCGVRMGWGSCRGLGRTQRSTNTGGKQDTPLTTPEPKGRQEALVHTSAEGLWEGGPCVARCCGLHQPACLQGNRLQRAWVQGFTVEEANPAGEAEVRAGGGARPPKKCLDGEATGRAPCALLQTRQKAAGLAGVGPGPLCPLAGTGLSRGSLQLVGTSKCTAPPRVTDSAC